LAIGTSWVSSPKTSCRSPDPLAETNVDDDVGPVLERRERLGEILARSGERPRVDGELLSVVLFRGPADDEDVDRFDDLTAPERRCGPSRDELRLVGVVVEDLPDAVEVQL